MIGADPKVDIELTVPATPAAASGQRRTTLAILFADVYCPELLIH